MPARQNNTQYCAIMQISFEQLMEQLKEKQYHPVYLLHGEEPFFIDKVVRHFEHEVLEAHQRAFNLTVVYGKDTDAQQIRDAAMRYPMMAPRQVIIVKEAQEMRDLSALLPYVQKPAPTTILVLAHKHKRLKTHTKLGKALAAQAVVMESKPLYENQVPTWIANHLESYGFTISDESSQLLAEYLGTDLSRIANELNKLVLNLQKGTCITPQHIETHIGISREFNVFELQRALAHGDTTRLGRILAFFVANHKKHPPIMVIATLFNFFSRLYMFHYLRKRPEKEVLQAMGLRSSWFLKDYKAAARRYGPTQVARIIHLLRRYDLKAKGVDFAGTADSELLKELLWQIITLATVPEHIVKPPQ